MSENLEEKLQKSGFLWCLHCEKVYKIEGSNKPDYDLECPFCGASALTDGWDWSRVKAVNPEYPEIPKAGVYYPMYPHERSE